MNEWPDDLPCPKCGKIIEWEEHTVNRPRSGDESWIEHDGVVCEGAVCSYCNKKDWLEDMEECHECKKQGCGWCMEYRGSKAPIHTNCWDNNE